MLFDEKRASFEFGVTKTIYSIILRHTSVENSNHVKTFLLIYAHFNVFSNIFELRFHALKKNMSLKETRNSFKK